MYDVISASFIELDRGVYARAQLFRIVHALLDHEASAK